MKRAVRNAVRFGLAAIAAVANPGEAISQAQQPPRYTESVTVARVLVDARVVDGQGQPILGLDASHFKVRVDGKPARVESVEWLGEGRPPTPSRLDFRGLSEAQRSPARLVVFLVQKDLEPTRIVGLMRMLLNTRRFLDSLGAEDRVAVLSFDSRLKVWLDFTRDMDKVRTVLEHGILFEKPPPVEAAPPPALLPALDVKQAARAYTMEDSLVLLGRALEPLPGAKSVVYIGHGFGRLMDRHVYAEPSYGEAKRALQAARAAVFCVDVTDAAEHSLDAGLQVTARDTGGFFLRTNEFPGQVMGRLTGALAGQYVLFVEVTAPVARQAHEIEVELVNVRDGRVLAKRSYHGG